MTKEVQSYWFDSTINNCSLYAGCNVLGNNLERGLLENMFYEDFCLWMESQIFNAIVNVQIPYYNYALVTASCHLVTINILLIMF